MVKMNLARYRTDVKFILGCELQPYKEFFRGILLFACFSDSVSEQSICAGTYKWLHGGTNNL